MAALRELDEVEPPEYLVHNIIAKTAYAESGVAVRMPGGVERDSLWNRFKRSVLHPVVQPRFVMSMGMAFFSITLTLNVAGVSRKDLVNLRPSTLRTTAMVKLNEAEGRIIHYYESLRAVYEFESLIREVKKNEKKPEEQKDKNNDTSQARPAPDASGVELATHSITVGPSETEMQFDQVRDKA
jgi:hypothetical protein